MKIVVCIKQIIDPELPAAQFSIDEDKKRQNRNGHPLVISPYDENALEAALKIKEKTATVVTAISVGDDKTIAALRKAIAMGADEAVLIKDAVFENPGVFGTALALARGIQKLDSYDFVFFGCESADSGAKATGSATAEILQIPCITYVTQIEVQGDNLQVHKVIEDGHERWECQPRTALTVLSCESNVPRYPKVKDIMTASRRTVPVWSAADLGIRPEEMAELNGRTEIIKLSVPSRDSRCEIIEGEAEEQVSVLISKLKERRVF